MANQFSYDFNTLVGQKFGLLTIVKKAPAKIANGCYIGMVLCKCDCGNMKICMLAGLKRGHPKSCGCIKMKGSLIGTFTHGLSSHRLHSIWSKMKSRCYRKTDPKYKDYGGRGIIVIEEWRNKPDTFFKWALANGYAGNLTIERINVNGNYEPQNCKWITMEEQALNKQNSHIITYNGKTQHLSLWCKELNMPYGRLQSRLKRGVPIDKLFDPPNNAPRRKRILISDLHKPLIITPSVDIAAKITKCDISGVRSVLNNRAKQWKGFIFSYP